MRINQDITPANTTPETVSIPSHVGGKDSRVALLDLVHVLIASSETLPTLLHFLVLETVAVILLVVVLTPWVYILRR